MEYHQQPGSSSLRGNLNLLGFFLFNITWSNDYFRTIILEFFLIFLRMLRCFISSLGHVTYFGHKNSTFMFYTLGYSTRFHLEQKNSTDLTAPNINKNQK